MDENIKFSIIVPCFNVERYIGECVRSVLKQSYKNWELILVDDGSSDGTYSKICNLADLDERIFAYRKKHSGLPGTRNYALNYVTGDYLVLLDGDDYLAVSHLEEDSKLLRANNVDMLIHNQHTNFTATNKEQIVLFPKSLVAGNQEKLAVVFDVRNYLPASAVLTTYSIKFLKRNGLIYTEKYRCSEDLDFFLNAISKAPEINFAYHEFYFYRQDNSSAMTKKMSI
uniref:glycosyltransferase family 2 protein n=1 Tax=Anaerovibrio slackiae TaxID=2652309 RepID=UPI00386AE336